MRRATLRRKLRALTLGTACAGLLALPAAALEPVSAASDPETGEPLRLAAADAAGWLVFPAKRSGQAQDWTGGPLRLRNAVEPETPTAPGVDWLDLWGLVQIRSIR
jgi:hypothetical protein